VVLESHEVINGTKCFLLGARSGMTDRIKKNVLVILFVAFIGLPLVTFLIGSLVFFTIIYWPSHFDQLDLARYTTSKERVVLLAHGVRDDTRTWIDPLRAIFLRKEFDGDVIPVDWSAYAKSSVRCAIEGKRIGELIGERLRNSRTIKFIHMIGHSCGAFVVYGACSAIKKTRPDIEIQATYLDPVSIYGPLWNYGLKHFGHCADYGETYIDTEDDVRGSNELVPNTHTYDVTALRTPTHSHIRPHNWPTVYYLQLVETDRAPDYRRDRALLSSKPPGQLEIVRRPSKS
jgi:hypothetical protein